MVECGVCRFGSSPAPFTPAAAFVLMFAGKSMAEVLASTDARASGRVVAGCSSYCKTCRRVTWLSRHESVADALVRHEHDWAIAVCVQAIQAMD